MGKYFEFKSPGAYDSGANVYSAKHILDGAEIGVEEKHSASLGTLLVNILGVWLCGFNETGPKLVQTILQAAALLLMFVAARKLFGTLPAAVCVIVASVYLSAPLIAKFGNVLFCISSAANGGLRSWLGPLSVGHRCLSKRGYRQSRPLACLLSSSRC
jgi:hypothetical protein